MQEVVTRCLAIYETAVDGGQDPVHLARWMIPAQDTVVMLKNENFSDPVVGGGQAT
jgi:hypothetical protein